MSPVLIFAFGFVAAIAGIAAVRWLETCGAEDPVVTLSNATCDTFARLEKRLDAIEHRLRVAEESGLRRDGLTEPVEAYATPGRDAENTL